MRIKHPDFMVKVLLGMLMLPNAALAESKPGTAELVTQAADAFMTQFAERQAERNREVRYNLGSVDERLSLAPCPNPLDVEFTGDPEQTTRATLLVSCEGNRPWRLFLNSDIEIIVEGWVSAQPIGRGQRLKRDMLEREEVIINKRRRSGFRDPDNMLGMEAKRGINTGVPITPDMLVKPDAVERGDRVVISSGTDAFSIQTRGEAVGGGRIGEQISVINENSGRRVRGRITGPGRVSVAP